MSKDKRKNAIQFYVTDDELAIINERMRETGISNKSEYIRRMAVDGLTVNVDCTDIRKLCSEVSAIGRNINQVTRLINGSGKVYQHDLNTIKESLDKIWHMLRHFLSATT